MKRHRTLTVTLAALLLVAVQPPQWAAGQEPALLWYDVHDGGANQIDEGIAVLTDPAGHAIVGGFRTTPGGRSEIFVRKLDRRDGAPIWTFTFADADGSDLILADLVSDHRGDLLVAGYLSDCDG
jgi:hypothetical protein